MLHKKNRIEEFHILKNISKKISGEIKKEDKSIVKNISIFEDIIKKTSVFKERKKESRKCYNKRENTK